jgi:hypothetical protein
MKILKLARYYQEKLAMNSFLPSKEEENLAQCITYAKQLISIVDQHPGVKDVDAVDIPSKCDKLLQNLETLITEYKNLNRTQIYNQARLLWNLAGHVEQRCHEDLPNSINAQQLATQISDVVYNSFKDWQPGLPSKKK